MCHKRAIVCGFCVVVGGIFSYTRSLQTSSQQKILGASRQYSWKIRVILTNVDEWHSISI